MSPSAGALSAVALTCAMLCAADDPFAASAQPEVQIGTALPRLELQDDQGQSWSSEKHPGKRMVLYFYPGDFTPGCIGQACKFQEKLAELATLDVEVIGISGDLPETHRMFKKAHGVGYRLLADPEGHAARQLGVPVSRGGRARLVGPDRQPILGPKNKSIFVERGVTIARWTFVVDRDGTVLWRRKGVDPNTDAAEVLEYVKMLP